jgi:hypothetical protein
MMPESLMKFSHLKFAFAWMLISLVFPPASYSAKPSMEASPLSQEVARLRQKGADGLKTFLQSHSREFNAVSSPEIKTALDQLCQQKDCYAAKLYWFTDFEQAKAAAKASHKPILSLRLLGRLDTDLSCANSRFFRVALYPNAEISQFLRKNFILHWESVRPVPKVTIDFGDGRKLERTITGNSIHYILDSSGRPIEAIPGLYGPKAFLNQLQQGELLAQNLSHLSDSKQGDFLRQYHRQRLNALETQWKADLSRLGIKVPPRLIEVSNNIDTTNVRDAAPLAISKMVVERPIINAVQPEKQTNSFEIIDQKNWENLGKIYKNDVKLDSNSISLIQTKKLPATPNQITLATVVRNFETAMALDTVRNEYILHKQIHQWFSQGNKTSNLVRFNEKVYAELFLTPSSDPWLGLSNNDMYSAIDNGGIVNNVKP